MRYLKMVTIKTLDTHGDSELKLAIDAAIAETVKAHFQFGKWPYVGQNFFQFSAASETDAVALLEDVIRLKAMLEESGEPVIVLTGDLQGGDVVAVEKMVTIKTLDTHGDSELKLKIDAAIAETVKAHFQFGKWPYVGQNFFQFSAASETDAVALIEDTLRLKAMLEESGEPVIVLTGDLQGGKL